MLLEMWLFDRGDVFLHLLVFVTKVRLLSSRVQLGQLLLTITLCVAKFPRCGWNLVIFTRQQWWLVLNVFLKTLHVRAYLCSQHGCYQQSMTLYLLYVVLIISSQIHHEAYLPQDHSQIRWCRWCVLTRWAMIFELVDSLLCLICYPLKPGLKCVYSCHFIRWLILFA